jgi:hypothetical protein
MLLSCQMTSTQGAEPPALTTIRTVLLWTLVLGCGGTLAELLLIGHDESWPQFVPLVLLASGIVIGVVALAAPSLTGLRALKSLMLVFLLSGAVGVGLHFRGNQEFELERQPTAHGFSLFSKTVTGATPVLAPGSMTLLGVVGLALTYRHPLLRSSAETLSA